jgi:hypothetical protein
LSEVWWDGAGGITQQRHSTAAPHWGRISVKDANLQARQITQPLSICTVACRQCWPSAALLEAACVEQGTHPHTAGRWPSGMSCKLLPWHWPVQ